MKLGIFFISKMRFLTFKYDLWPWDMTLTLTKIKFSLQCLSVYEDINVDTPSYNGKATRSKILNIDLEEWYMTLKCDLWP